MLPFITISKEDKIKADNKSQLILQAGIHYKNFIDDKYIEPTQYNYGDEIDEHQYERFTKIPTFGYSIGLLFTCKLDKRVNLVTGLQYFLRRSVFENNRDTIIKYHTGTNLKNISNVFEYDYSYNNIEIPILFTWSYNKLSLYAGFNLSLISYKKGFYNYIVNQYPYQNSTTTPYWTNESKTLYGFETHIKIFPTVQASYQFQFGNFEVNPFIGFYYALEQHNDFYIQLGVNLPLSINKKENSIEN